MNFKEYLYKVCTATEDKVEVKAYVDQGKKYCDTFVKSEDGYCINYTGPKPCVMTCSVQCKIF